MNIKQNQSMINNNLKISLVSRRISKKKFSCDVNYHLLKIGMNFCVNFS